MTQDAADVAKVIELNGGELIGRTRLQKTFYFLERLGVGFGFDFQYHHYGPFSEDLAQAADDAIALGFVDQDRKTGTKLQPYSVFRLNSVSLLSEHNDAKRKKVLQTLLNYDAITVELAATADFLDAAGFGDRAWDETILRKSSKASPERLARAKSLLVQLHKI